MTQKMTIKYEIDFRKGYRTNHKKYPSKRLKMTY